jgi:hypothetical protein
MSGALRRSFEVLPPTHFVRVTMLDPMAPKELTRRVRNFLRRLRRHGCEYFALNEWRQGKRHHHVLVRTAGELTRTIVVALWRASCQGAKGTSYCQPLRNPDGAARYVAKDLRDRSKKEIPPAEFGGRLFSSSKQFFTKPLKVLMKEVVEEWRARVRKRTGELEREGSSEGSTEEGVQSDGQSR